MYCCEAAELVADLLGQAEGETGFRHVRCSLDEGRPAARELLRWGSCAFIVLRSWLPARSQPAPRAAAGGRAPTLPGARACPIFPASNVWNRPVTDLPVAANSAAMIGAIGLDAPVHPDFGSFLGYGIPYNVVSAKKLHKVHVSFDYADESDKVAYPMPAHPRQEGGGDAHVLVVDKNACRLYELYAAHESGGSVEGRLRRGLEPALQPPAPGQLDERRRRRAADPARPRALRRGRLRRHPARAALHGLAHDQCAHLPGPPRRRRLRRVAAADGAARPAQGLGRHLGLRRSRPASSCRRSRPTG